MRSIEIFMVIVIILGALTITTYFAVLPSPSQVAGSNLRELSISTLETLDVDGDLSATVFNDPSDPSWMSLQLALEASLPVNIVYNLSAYDIVTSPDGTVTYSLVGSISNSENELGASSDASSYTVTSSDTMFTITPQKIGESFGRDITLYVLNCNDANGWWITGYTAQSLASDIRTLLSPYFYKTVLVNSTAQLGQILDGAALQGERLQDAVIVNTFGESIPIPAGYYTTQGYDASHDSYARYSHILGQRVNTYNWTWVSIVGYPFYYVSNTATFASTQAWGIYGTRSVGPPGLNAFLRGIDGQSYSYSSSGITGSPGVVQFTWNASYYSNYYGIYPSPYQTSTRALPTSIMSTYDLTVAPNAYIFQVVGNWIAGATFNHRGAGNIIHGSLTAIGLTRTPDIRITALGLLQHYRPSIYKSEFGASGTSRLVVLQLAQHGGV